MYNHTGSLMLKTALILSLNDAANPQDRWTNTIDLANKGINSQDTCYDGLGCYSINAPWVSESRPVANYPLSPEQIDPIFCLYTLKNRDKCHRLYYNDSSTLTQSPFVPNHKVYLISHGFLENGNKKWIQVMKNRLLNKSDSNIIVIGWPGGSSPPYTQAVANIRVVGTMGAFLLNALHKHVGMRTEFCHAIGHSLGAHLVGYIGNTIKTHFGLTLGRISALDPAEPHFSKTDPIVRLDPTDAIFVDVVHTDITPFIKGGLGMDEPIGHLDFYPNGGESQPGCDKSVKKYVEEDGSVVKAIRRFLGCDHVRSYEYFIESITTKCDFLAVECETYEKFRRGECFGCKSDVNQNGPECAQMGFNSIKSIQETAAESGIMYKSPERAMVKLFTVTGSKQPYCRALYRVTIKISSSKESIEHGGEVGIFSLKIIGIRGTTDVIEFLKEKTYQPGTKHQQVVGSTQVGRIKSAQVTFVHPSSILNMLTWRMNISRVYLESVIIDNLVETSGIRLCPEGGEIMHHGKEMDMRPCGDPTRMDGEVV